MSKNWRKQIRDTSVFEPPSVNERPKTPDLLKRLDIKLKHSKVNVLTKHSQIEWIKFKEKLETEYKKIQFEINGLSLIMNKNYNLHFELRQQRNMYYQWLNEYISNVTPINKNNVKHKIKYNNIELKKLSLEQIKMEDELNKFKKEFVDDSTNNVNIQFDKRKYISNNLKRFCKINNISVNDSHGGWSSKEHKMYVIIYIFV